MNLRDRFPECFIGYEPDPDLLGIDPEPASAFLHQALCDNFNAKFGGYQHDQET